MEKVDYKKEFEEFVKQVGLTKKKDLALAELFYQAGIIATLQKEVKKIEMEIMLDKLEMNDYENKN